jgi:hypothetical protein
MFLAIFLINQEKFENNNSIIQFKRLVPVKNPDQSPYYGNSAIEMNSLLFQFNALFYDLQYSKGDMCKKQ